MARVLLFGAVLAVLGAAVVAFGAVMGIAFANVLVGMGAGAVLGLVRERTPVARAGAFIIGLLLCVVFYLLRLSIIPQNWAGLAVSIFFFILLLTLISGLTKGRLPLWAMLLGSLVFSAGYDADFVATPWYALSQIPMVLAGMMACASAGFMVTLLVELRERRGGVDPIDPMAPADAPVEAVAAGGQQ